MGTADRAAFILGRLQKKRPLIHNITNYVTANDCANILLAVGASPVMADDPEETAEIAGLSDGLVLNMGTPSERKLDAMKAAGKSANRKGIPVIFDPVGAGTSRLRRKIAEQLLREVRVDMIRGNLSEISFLAGMGSREKGVDVSAEDLLTDPLQAAGEAAVRLGCTVVVTGTADVATDGHRILCIHNGTPLLSRVTGTGCMSSSLAGAFAAADPENLLDAAAAAAAAMGIAGELAQEQAGHLGYGSFHMALLDAVGRLDEKTIRERARIEER